MSIRRQLDLSALWKEWQDSELLKNFSKKLNVKSSTLNSEEELEKRLAALNETYHPKFDAKTSSAPTFHLPDAREVHSLALPVGVNVKGDKTFVTHHDNKAFIIPISKESRNSINDFVNQHLESFNKQVTGAKKREDLPALNLGNSPLRNTSPIGHPLTKDIFDLLQNLANNTGCTIITSSASNNFLTNYYSQRGQKAFEKDTRLKRTLFTSPDNPVAGLHIDQDRDADVFNFTVSIFTCNEIYSKVDRKRMLFPQPGFSENDRSNAVFVDIDYNNPFMIVFPSYALHGTEEWELKQSHAAAQKIQHAYRKHKENKKLTMTTLTKTNPELDSMMSSLFHSTPVSEESMITLDNHIDRLSSTITQESHVKSLKEKKATFSDKALDLWLQENKVKLRSECIAWLKRNESKVPDDKLMKKLEDKLEQDERKLGFLLETTSFPYRISIVWRGTASKTGLNCEQIAKLIGDSLMHLNVEHKIDRPSHLP